MGEVIQIPDGNEPARRQCRRQCRTCDRHHTSVIHIGRDPDGSMIMNLAVATMPGSAIIAVSRVERRTKRIR
jgi:hypothetical protein